MSVAAIKNAREAFGIGLTAPFLVGFVVPVATYTPVATVPVVEAV